MNTSEEFDSDPFSFQPLKRRRRRSSSATRTQKKSCKKLKGPGKVKKAKNDHRGSNIQSGPILAEKINNMMTGPTSPLLTSSRIVTETSRTPPRIRKVASLVDKISPIKKMTHKVGEKQRKAASGLVLGQSERPVENVTPVKRYHHDSPAVRTARQRKFLRDLAGNRNDGSQSDMFKESDQYIHNDLPQADEAEAGPSGAVHNKSRHVSEEESGRSESLFAVNAERDSQELDVSVRIKPTVHCTRVKLRIPLQQTDSGQEKPVEISANYTDINSPGKNKPQSTKKENIRLPERSRAEKVRGQSKKERLNEIPSHKIIGKTGLAVDCFSYGEIGTVSHYLLSHFHYDHFLGLSRHWSHRVVCSSLTKRLLTSKLKVREALITTLDVGESRKFGESLVTALDANHCPGSLMFLIRHSGQTFLHTGDFRASPDMESLPVFWQADFSLSRLYLDTTYCRPEYDFPALEDVIDKTLQLVKSFLSEKPNTVILIGAYDVGKEKLLKAVVERLGCKVWGDEKRISTWRCLEEGELLGRLVGDRARAQVQVITNSRVTWAKLGLELEKLKRGGWRHVLGVKPTGWSHARGEHSEASLTSLAIHTRGEVSLLEVPYSEHSSYSELERFVKFLRLKSPNDIVDIVSKSKRQRTMTRDIFVKWTREVSAQ